MRWEIKSLDDLTWLFLSSSLPLSRLLLLFLLLFAASSIVVVRLVYSVNVCSVMNESGSSFTGVEELLGGLLLWKNMIFEYR